MAGWDEVAQGIVLFAAALTALGLIGRSLRKAWRWCEAEMRLAQARLAKLDAIDSAVGAVHAEVLPNGGSSMRDAIDRVEERQVAQRGDIVEIRERVAIVEAYVDELKGRERRAGSRVRSSES